MSISIPVCVPMTGKKFHSICLSVYLSLRISIQELAHLCAYLSVYSSICPSGWLSTCLYICCILLSVYLPVCYILLSVYLPVCYISLSVYLPVCHVSQSVYLPVCHIWWSVISDGPSYLTVRHICLPACVSCLAGGSYIPLGRLHSLINVTEMFINIVLMRPPGP